MPFPDIELIGHLRTIVFKVCSASPGGAPVAPCGDCYANPPQTYLGFITGGTAILDRHELISLDQRCDGRCHNQQVGAGFKGNILHSNT